MKIHGEPLLTTLLSIPEFGLPDAGQNFLLRPGSYAVIRNVGVIAVVHTPFGVFLPGGGNEPGESAESALVREVAEECGLAVDALEFLGVADELAYSQRERQHFRKRCSFFTAVARSGAPTLVGEPDHKLSWVTAEAAALRLSHQSHRWGLTLSGSLF